MRNAKILTNVQIKEHAVTAWKLFAIWSLIKKIIVTSFGNHINIKIKHTHIQ
jgi:hypothetical protein